jgi:TPR repeat protein
LEKNQDEALNWFKKAAKQGDKEAENILKILETIDDNKNELNQDNEKPKSDKTTLDVTKNTEQEQKTIENKNDIENENAKWEIKNEDIPKDHDEAFKYIQNLAEQGNAEAQCRLGTLFLMTATKGQSNQSQKIELIRNAIDLLSKSAEQGHPRAMFVLGTIYENGTGVPKNIDKAIELYRKADAKGIKDTKNALKRLNAT